MRHLHKTMPLQCKRPEFKLCPALGDQSVRRAMSAAKRAALLTNFLFQGCCTLGKGCQHVNLLLNNGYFKISRPCVEIILSVSFKVQLHPFKLTSAFFAEIWFHWSGFRFHQKSSFWNILQPILIPELNLISVYALPFPCVSPYVNYPLHLPSHARLPPYWLLTLSFPAANIWVLPPWTRH